MDPRPWRCDRRLRGASGRRALVRLRVPVDGELRVRRDGTVCRPRATISRRRSRDRQSTRPRAASSSKRPVPRSPMPTRAAAGRSRRARSWSARRRSCIAISPRSSRNRDERSHSRHLPLRNGELQDRAAVPLARALPLLDVPQTSRDAVRHGPRRRAAKLGGFRARRQSSTIVRPIRSSARSAAAAGRKYPATRICRTSWSCRRARSRATSV